MKVEDILKKIEESKDLFNEYLVVLDYSSANVYIHKWSSTVLRQFILDCADNIGEMTKKLDKIDDSELVGIYLTSAGYNLSSIEYMHLKELSLTTVKLVDEVDNISNFLNQYYNGN